MWRAFTDLVHKKAPAVNGKTLGLIIRRERGHPARRCPGPPIMGAAKAERRPSRLRGRRDPAIIEIYPHR